MNDRIVKTVLTTNYSKKSLNTVMVFLITVLVRSIINTIACLILLTNIWMLDFVIQISLGVAIVIHTDFIYYNINKYSDDVLRITTYFVDNYNASNLRIWKRNLILTICIYFIIILWLVPINSYMAIEYIAQYLICYLIVDNIENRNGLLFDIFEKIQEERLVKVKRNGEIEIIDDYKNVVSKEKKLEEDFFLFDEYKQK